MHNSRKLLKIRSFHFNSRAEHRKFSRVSLFLKLLVFAGSITACVMGTTSTPTIVSTPITDCFPSSVFTAADMQARVDCHPNDYKLTISKDTVVLFAFPSPILDWIGPIFIIHIPSVSEVVVKTDGSLFIKDYKSPEGQAAIERVLNNSEVMTRILERARKIQEGPLVPHTDAK